MARLHKWLMNEWKTYLKVGKYCPCASRWKLIWRYPLKVWKSCYLCVLYIGHLFVGLSLPIRLLNPKNQEKIRTRDMGLKRWRCCFIYLIGKTKAFHEEKGDFPPWDGSELTSHLIAHPEPVYSSGKLKWWWDFPHQRPVRTEQEAFLAHWLIQSKLPMKVSPEDNDDYFGLFFPSEVFLD